MTATRLAMPTGFTPGSSLLTTLLNLVCGRVHFPQHNRGRRLVMEDGSRHRIFRHVRVDAGQRTETPTVVFKVRFRLANMSPGLNKLFSLLPIPLFIGLPGFRAKCWCLDEESGVFQGLYEWQTEEHAKAYASSFGMRFMVARSVPGTVSHEILVGQSLDEYLDSVSADENEVQS